MNIKSFLAKLVYISSLGYSIANAQPVAPSCLQEARDLGRRQTSFLDPLERGFSHPGLYVDATPLRDEELGELSQKLAAKLDANSAEFQDAFALLAGVLAYDGDLSVLSKVEQKRFESVVKDIEKKGIWQQLSSLSSEKLLPYLARSVKSMNDLSRFGIPVYPKEYREGALLVRKAWGKSYTFYEINEMRQQLAQSERELKIYNTLVEDVAKLYAVHNRGKKVFPLGQNYKDYWNITIQTILMDPVATSPKAQFVSKYYRLFSTGPKEIKAQMTAMLEEVQARLDKGEDPIKVAAYAHQRTIDIHPFADGNGRTARLLVNIILRNGGYPSIAIMSDKEYTQTILRSLDAGDDQIVEAFLAKKLCQKTKKLEIERDLYGKDIENLAASCAQKAKQYYFPSVTDRAKGLVGLSSSASPIKECKESFASLINAYEAKELTGKSSQRLAEQDL